MRILDLQKAIKHCSMCEALGYIVDPYRMLACQHFNTSYELVSKEQRAYVKQLAYLTMYTTPGRFS